VIELSDSITALAKALPGAQRAFAKVTRDASNPHFQNKYASLSEIAEATVPALNAAGITVLQGVTTSEDGGSVEVETMLLHDSAQWLRATHTVPISKRDAQGVGSALTYARRQALQALLTVAPVGEDDDGEGAVGRGSGRPPLPPAPPAQKPTMHDRVARLERTIGEVKTERDLAKAWDLAKELRAELARNAPSVAERLNKQHEARHVELIQQGPSPEDAQP
jgi:hypothetical protein